MKNTSKLYETDFYQWSKETLRAIRERDIENLDWENLELEIESLTKSEERAVKSYLRQLLTHLLLYQYWYDKRLYTIKKWEQEIYNFRTELEELLESKRLEKFARNEFEKAYRKAIKKAVLKFEGEALTPPLFSNSCPYSFEQVLDPEFLPEPKEAL